MDLNKKRIHYEGLNKDFESLSTTVIQQLQLTVKIFEEGWNTEIEKEINRNEKNIAILEASFMERFPMFVLLFSPKAKELRKIISCHEVILYMEEISDNVLIIIEYLKKVNLNSSDFDDFKLLMIKMFQKLQFIISSTTYSFYREDYTQASNILEKENDIKKLSYELHDNLIAAFQDIPLSGQEMMDIISLNKIGLMMERITNYALNIAKATIFVEEGNKPKN